jgi:cyclophilin family peptidyl-prolyl cis-trans isomerase
MTKTPTFDGTYLTGKHTVTLKTTKGDIVLELDADAAPKTVTNFITLAKAGYYDGIGFHRVIDDFMIQGGDPTGTGRGGESIYGKDFEDENLNGAMVRGVLAMANRGPATNGSQFFIITRLDTSWLQGKHTPFGKVTKGMEVADAIAKLQEDDNGTPSEEVTFTAVVGKDL